MALSNDAPLSNDALGQVLLRAASSTAEAILQKLDFVIPFGIGITVDDETIPYTTDLDSNDSPGEHMDKVVELMLADAHKKVLQGIALGFFCQVRPPGAEEEKYAIGVQVEIPHWPMYVGYRLQTNGDDKWTFEEEFRPIPDQNSKPRVFSPELGTVETNNDQ